jgi:Cd2+/Zn2+-exporting ATPase
LENVNGVESIAVNIIGRYIVVKHCVVECCAPSEKIIGILNSKHLGVSIQDVAGKDGGLENVEETLDKIFLLYACVLWVFFIGGLVCSFLPGQGTLSMALYLVSVIVGVIPILKSSIISLLRLTIDINILVVLAIIGALASGEYFDSSLVVSLFISAEFVESLIMIRVRNAVNLNSPKLSKNATLVNGQLIPLADLKIGDMIAIRAGLIVT